MSTYGDKSIFVEQTRNGGISMGRAPDVTQITSLTTGVTSDGYSGKITTVTATVATDATTAFTVTNNIVTTNSLVNVFIMDYTGAGQIHLHVSNISSGSFSIRISNYSGTFALNDAIEIGYTVFN